MPKYFLRIVAVLLIPCLVAEPAIASLASLVHHPETRSISLASGLNTRDCTEEQALTLTLVCSVQPLHDSAKVWVSKFIVSSVYLAQHVAELHVTSMFAHWHHWLSLLVIGIGIVCSLAAHPGQGDDLPETKSPPPQKRGHRPQGRRATADELSDLQRQLNVANQNGHSWEDIANLTPGTTKSAVAAIARGDYGATMETFNDLSTALTQLPERPIKRRGRVVGSRNATSDELVILRQRLNEAHEKGHSWADMGRQAKTKGSTVYSIATSNLGATKTFCDGLIKMLDSLPAEPSSRTSTEPTAAQDYLAQFGISTSDPRFRGMSLTKIKAILEYLQSLNVRKIGRVLSSCPKLPGYGLEKIQETVEYLESQGVAPIALAIDRFPALLACSLEESIKPKVEYLRREGVARIGRLISYHPQIVSYSLLDKIEPTVRIWLAAVSQGPLLDKDLVSLLLKNTGILMWVTARVEITSVRELNQIYDSLKRRLMTEHQASIAGWLKKSGNEADRRGHELILDDLLDKTLEERGTVRKQTVDGEYNDSSVVSEPENPSGGASLTTWIILVLGVGTAVALRSAGIEPAGGIQESGFALPGFLLTMFILHNFRLPLRGKFLTHFSPALARAA